MRRWLAAVSVVAVALLGAPVPGAQAQDGTTWSLEPTRPQSGPGRNWFILELRPGQVLRDSVTLSNPTDRPLSFQIFAADAYNTPNGGDFAIRDLSEPREDVAAWIELATDAYTLQPGQFVDVPFELRVPENAEPGDHAGAIAAIDVNPESTTTSGGVALDIKRAVASRVYLRVPGPLNPSLRVEAVSVSTDAPAVPYTGDAGGDVSFRVVNDGNVRLAPDVDVEVSATIGGTLDRVPTVELPELLPGSSIDVSVPFEGLPPIGPVTAEVTATSTDVEVSAHDSRWVVPWVALLVLVALIALGGFRRQRRRKRERLAAGVGVPPARHVTKRVPAHR